MRFRARTTVRTGCLLWNGTRASGPARPPAWTANLLAHPDVEINWRGRDIPVRARLLSGAEREGAWATALAFWPPYARYQERVEREIRLFRLDRR
ncbi:hypothetical protein BLA24_10300 [Streptomyces cinnamoneus]|uniref:Nitroreductase family deazaflavin-dependent oxidoreductase n=1 Tax=Streptomyces cinnamoneus TaxID=53446 RepID=A0A2G1XL81_STRCJ|nr:nitroreductase family deazaflavin-dependent oxidoreductase [Streptomyces cinnamoneus]PHQ51995.1 hypothetical protein BLA24_10300 [Streptomyces cinnamoneus]